MAGVGMPAISEKFLPYLNNDQGRNSFSESSNLKLSCCQLELKFPCSSILRSC